MRHNPWLLVGLVIGSLTALLIYLFNYYPGALDSTDNLMRFLYLSILLAAIGGGRLFAYRGSVTVALKQALAWIAIFMVLVIGYSYRDYFDTFGKRVGGELMPTSAHEESYGVVSLPADRLGHFSVDALVHGPRTNGSGKNTHIRFLVDTGASTVSLTLSDAARLGIDRSQLSFTRQFNTANGVVFGAPVILPSIQIGSILIPDVRAVVLNEGLKSSLLGMTYLRRLSSFEISDDRLTLRN